MWVLLEQSRKPSLQESLSGLLDPSAGLRGVMDIGIAGGKIVAVAPSLPEKEALRSISAKGQTFPYAHTTNCPYMERQTSRPGAA